MSSIPAAFSEAHISEERPWRDIKSGFTHFAEGDVGVAKITPCFENGKSTVFQKLSNGVGAGTTELHIVRPFCGLVPQYVLLFLKTPRFLQEGERGMTGSAGQKRLSRAYFENTPFPLPPLAEQSRIVTRVEELMRLCEALQAKARLEATQHAQLVNTLLATLTASTTPEALTENWHRVATHFDLLLDRPEAVDALEQTILQLAVRGLLVPQDPQDEPASQLLKKIRAEKDKRIAEGKIKSDKPLPPIAEDEKAFELPQGWEWVRLGDVAKVISGYAFSSEDFSTESGIRAIKITNAGVGELNETDDFLPISFKSGFEAFTASENDLILALTRPYVSNGLKVSRCPASYHGALINQRVAAIRCHQSLASEFAFGYMQSPDVLSIYQNRFNGSGLQPNLKVSDVTELAVPLPPLAEQSRIVARVASLRALCADLRQRLTTARAQQALLAATLVQGVAHS